MAITAALIGGGATLASAGIGAASTLAANNRGANDQIGLRLAQLQDSRNNEAYQQALNALMIQQARAGYTDSEGSSVRYDPATNTYVSTLGQRPQAARNAALDAMVKRNTTDQEMARFANQEAAKRALQGGNVADQTRRAFESYRPISGTQLGDLLQQRGAIATNDAYRPIISEALTQAARTGSTAGGQIIADVGRQSAADLRKNAIDATIQGMTGAADVNRSNLGTLGSAYTTASANANPTFQFPGIATDDTNKTMANIAAQRAQLGVSAAAAAGQNANTATRVSGLSASDVPAENTNLGSQQLAGLGNILSPDKIKSLADDAKTIFGGNTNTNVNAFRPGVDPAFAPALVPGQVSPGGFVARQVF